MDLERGGGSLPAIVSGAPFAVVPPSTTEAEIVPTPGNFVGSGGYVLSAVDQNAFVLTANPHYWAGKPAIDTVHMLTTLGANVPSEAFAAGDVDVTPVGSLDSGWIAYDRALGPSLRSDPSLSVTYYGFDTRQAPFNDVRVRQAFAQAVDWRRLAALDEPGSSVPATGMVPAGMPGAPAGDFMPPYDPAAARQLLADAGFPGGKGLPPVSFVANGGGYDEAIVTMLEENLGVTIDYATMDFGDVPGAPRHGPAATLEPLLGGRLSGPQRLPGRPARDRINGEPGRLVERRVRRRDLDRHRCLRARRGHGGLREGAGDREGPGTGRARRVRDLVLAGPRWPAGRQHDRDGDPPAGRDGVEMSTTTRALPKWRLGGVLPAVLVALALLLPAGAGVAWAADAGLRDPRSEGRLREVDRIHRGADIHDPAGARGAEPSLPLDARSVHHRRAGEDRHRVPAASLRDGPCGRRSRAQHDVHRHVEGLLLGRPDRDQRAAAA